jgi:hypothetical protein
METMHKRYHPWIEDLEFYSGERPSLQQGHYQVQPMKARHWTLTLEIRLDTREAPTKNAVHLYRRLRLPRPMLQVINT